MGHQRRHHFAAGGATPSSGGILIRAARRETRGIACLCKVVTRGDTCQRRPFSNGNWVRNAISGDTGPMKATISGDTLDKPPVLRQCDNNDRYQRCIETKTSESCRRASINWRSAPILWYTNETTIDEILLAPIFPCLTFLLSFQFQSDPATIASVVFVRSKINL